MNTRRGMLWGLAGLACFTLAPALGLPPAPPGAAVAELQSRQLWWGGAALGTAIGLWLLTNRSRPWFIRIAGIVFLVLPHIVGAPTTTEASVVPAGLARQFALASVSTDIVFWILLGAVGGFFYGRQQIESAG
jgi:cobalt transporter subunit CbtA